jgi:hypothetical protein
MKLIEPPQRPIEKDRLQSIVDQFSKTFKFGKTDQPAEDAIVARFVRGLDNRFVMLRNLQLEEGAEPFPLILVGPPGLAVLNVSQAKGFFRAKEDSWWEMNENSHQFGPGHPNMIKQSKDYAQKLADVLDAHNKAHPAVLPILVFANPGVHIETSNPAIRIVLMDGVDSLIDSLVRGPEVLHATEVTFLSDSLEIMVNPEKAILLGEGEDFFGRDLVIPEKKAPLTLPEIPLPSELPLAPVEKKLKFSKNQWLILVVLMIATIAVLLGAIIYVLKF